MKTEAPRHGCLQGSTWGKEEFAHGFPRLEEIAIDALHMRLHERMTAHEGEIKVVEGLLSRFLHQTHQTVRTVHTFAEGACLSHPRGVSRRMINDKLPRSHGEQGRHLISTRAERGTFGIGHGHR